LNKETTAVLKEYKKSKREAIKDLSRTDLGYIVDDGIQLSAISKKSEKLLDSIKELLLDYSKLKKEKVHVGSHGFANIGPTSSSSIEPKKLLEFLTKVGKKNLFLGLIKVNVTDAKKFLGEDAIKSILDTTSKEYGSVKFKVSKD